MSPLTLDILRYYDYAELTAFLDQTASHLPALYRKIFLVKLNGAFRLETRGSH